MVTTLALATVTFAEALDFESLLGHSVLSRLPGLLVQTFWALGTLLS